MTVIKHMNQLSKIVVFFIFICSIVYFVYWLWQRQPKNQNIEKPTTTFQKAEVKNQQEIESTLDIEPKDGTVVSTNKIKFQGKVNPNEYILIYSNLHQALIKASQDGNFETEQDLVPGLNIFNATTLKEDLSQNQATSVSLYLLTKDDPKDVSVLYTGSVKSIFDNLITLTTTTGEKTLRQKSSTKITFPKDAKKDDKDIRIGDYLIALGTQINEKEFSATSIEIRRGDKPVNSVQFAACQFLTAVKQNLASAKNIKDNKIIEFTLDKNSKIFQDSKASDNKSIVKDKKAIVFYQNQNGENLLISIYLLP